MYIYVYVCIHIYTVSQREHVAQDFGFQGDKSPGLPPPLCFVPSYINKYGPLINFYNQVMFISLKIVFFFFS